MNDRPSLKLILDCFVSWISWTYRSAGGKASSNTILVHCFEILKSQADPDVTEAATNCLIELLREAKDTPLAHTAILELTLGQLTGTLGDAIGKSLTEGQSETCERLSILCAFTAQGLRNPVCCFAHASPAIQRLLGFLVAFTATSPWVDGERNYIAENTFSFWIRLSHDVGHLQRCIEKGQLDEASESAAIFHARLFEEILSAVISLCQMPIEMCAVTPAEFVEFERDFEKFRAEVSNLLLDVAHVLTSDLCLERLLQALASIAGSGPTACTPTQAAERQARQEAHLFGIGRVINSMSKTPCPSSIYGLLDGLETLLLTEMPTSFLAIQNRIAAIHLAGEAAHNGWLSSRPALIPKMLENLASQVRPLNPPRADSTTPPAAAAPDAALADSVSIAILRSEAATAFRECCCRGADSPDMHTVVPSLVAAIFERFNEVPEQDFLLLLEGVGRAVGGVKADEEFLENIGSLCNPIIRCIVESTHENLKLALWLDRLAVVIKCLCPLATPSREEAFANFVVQQVWPIMREIFQTQLQHQLVIERAGRVLKHSMRCVGPLFKPIVPELTAVVTASSKICLRSTFLYIAEWLAAEYIDDWECGGMMAELFHGLADLGFRTLGEAARAGTLNDNQELIEDCYGMLCRYLQFCPMIPMRSPALATAMEYFYTVMQHPHKEVVAVVFGFVEILTKQLSRCQQGQNEDGEVSPTYQQESAKSSDLATMAATTVMPLMLQHLPNLLKELLKLLSTLPPDYVVQKIEVLLGTLQREMPRSAMKNCAAAALDALPPNVIQNANMRDRYAYQLACSRHEAIEAVEEIYHRCRELHFRSKQRA
eukprot:Polyplicarium_translucidae@DN2834_c0_g1_i2.p1